LTPGVDADADGKLIIPCGGFEGVAKLGITGDVSALFAEVVTTPGDASFTSLLSSE
jgi:hypothetical protein